MRFVCGQVRGPIAGNLFNAVAEIKVVDCTMACGPAVTLGATILEPEQMPFEYEIQYDDKVFANGVRGRYCIQASITIDGRLAFVNDTSISLINEYNNEILERVHVDVIPV